MSITIGDTLLNYKTSGDKYIITYINPHYNVVLDTYLDNIFRDIFPFYNSSKIVHSNVCGANSEFICKNLKIDGLTLGKIIITDWVIKNDEKIEIIKSVYGPIGITIGASYHALAYLEVTIEGTTYYVAIETTSCIPYKLQFYVGSDKGEFEKIINTRYQCSNFKISFDCDKDWIAIAYRGGKKRKTQKRKTQKRKTQKRKTQKTIFRKYVEIPHPHTVVI
jgi:hypothetical protein